MRGKQSGMVKEPTENEDQFENELVGMSLDRNIEVGKTPLELRFPCNFEDE